MEGKNFNKDLTNKDIAKLTRIELKKLFPHLKFTITSAYNKIAIRLKETNVSPFKAKNDINFELLALKGTCYNSSIDQLKKQYDDYVNSGYKRLNNYYIKSDWALSDEMKEVFITINDFVISYNYNHSDIQNDYFDTNFYLDLKIGDWDKPVIIL